MSQYVPSKKILVNYAKVLVNFALNSGSGVKAEEVVNVVVPDIAKPLYGELMKAVLKTGAYPIMRLTATGFDKDFYQLATDDQLKFFPKKYLKEKTNLIDHQLAVIAEPYPNALKQVDPKKIIMSRDAKKEYREWLEAKENKGKFTWTLGLWAVEAKAEIVGLSLKEYWQQIIKACYLDFDDPISKWKEIFKDQKKIKKTLNEMDINYLKMKGPDMDLKVGLGKHRIWAGGSGRNIPSFEIFTSPDWREVEGWIRFNEPVYRYGNVIQDTYFEVKKGLITKAKSKKGNHFLQAMLSSKNANKFGEVSLTDKRMSRITHPMAETLYDENIGGPHGNTHLAIGLAYKDCYDGDPQKLSKKDWNKLGYNQSAEHTDFVSTTKRKVTAVLNDGSEKVIYADGKFTFLKK